MNEEFYNKFFIRLDEKKNIVHGFSNAFERPQADDICINEQGGYQFRLYPAGEENPPIMNEYGIWLYVYKNKKVAKKTVDEIIKEIPVKDARIENLTQDGVNIVIIDREIIADNGNVYVYDGDRWRVALQNTTSGRLELNKTLEPYPGVLSQALSVWGETPTVTKPEPEGLPEETGTHIPTLQEQIDANAMAIMELADELYG